MFFLFCTAKVAPFGRNRVAKSSVPAFGAADGAKYPKVGIAALWAAAYLCIVIFQ